MEEKPFPSKEVVDEDWRRRREPRERPLAASIFACIFFGLCLGLAVRIVLVLVTSI